MAPKKVIAVMHGVLICEANASLDPIIKKYKRLLDPKVLEQYEEGIIYACEVLPYLLNATNPVNVEE